MSFLRDCNSSGWNDLADQPVSLQSAFCEILWEHVCVQVHVYYEHLQIYTLRRKSPAPNL